MIIVDTIEAKKMMMITAVKETKTLTTDEYERNLKMIMPLMIMMMNISNGTIKMMMIMDEGKQIGHETEDEEADDEYEENHVADMEEFIKWRSQIHAATEIKARDWTTSG